MSRSPVEVIRDLYRLFAEGRLEQTFALMDPDVQLVEPGDPALIPWAGSFRGHDGLRRFYQGLAEGLSEIQIDPDSLRFLEVGEGHVLALGTERGVAAASGREYSTRSAWLWEVHDGRIVSLEAFHDTEAMASAMRRSG